MYNNIVQSRKTKCYSLTKCTIFVIFRDFMIVVGVFACISAESMDRSSQFNFIITKYSFHGTTNERHNDIAIYLLFKLIRIEH